MKLMKIENSKVVNIAVFADGSKPPKGWQPVLSGVDIGHIDNGDGTYSVPVEKVPPEPTQEEIDLRKDIQVEAEIGTNAIRIIIETILPMIKDGSINYKTSDEIIAEAKVKRRAEL